MKKVVSVKLKKYPWSYFSPYYRWMVIKSWSEGGRWGRFSIQIRQYKNKKWAKRRYEKWKGIEKK